MTPDFLGFHFKIGPSLAKVEHSKVLSFVSLTRTLEALQHGRFLALCRRRPRFGILGLTLAVAVTTVNVADADCCSNWFGEAELLVWTSQQADLDYAIGTSDALNAPQPLDGKTYYIENQWSPGFRLALGYHLPCDCWDVKIVVTDIRLKSNSHVTFPTPESVGSPPFAVTPGVFSTLVAPSLLVPNPNLTGTSPQVTYTDAKASFHTQYDVVDLLLSRSLCINDCLHLAPYGGIRVLVLEQKEHAQYVNDSTQIDGPNNLLFGNTAVEVNWKSKYTAAGLHAGFETDYEIGCGWKVFGKIAGSLVAGDSQVRQLQHVQAYDVFGPLFDPVDRSIELKDNDDLLVVSGAEFNLGIGYDWYVCNQCITLSAAYEFVHWRNVPVIRRSTSDTAIGASLSSTTGGIGFHGGTFKAAIEF